MQPVFILGGDENVPTSSFAAQVLDNGIDGLIKSLSDMERIGTPAN